MSDEVEVEINYPVHHPFLAVMGRCDGCGRWYILDFNHRIPYHEYEKHIKNESGGTAIVSDSTVKVVCQSGGTPAGELKYAD